MGALAYELCQRDLCWRLEDGFEHATPEEMLLECGALKLCCMINWLDGNWKGRIV